VEAFNGALLYLCHAVSQKKKDDTWVCHQLLARKCAGRQFLKSAALPIGAGEKWYQMHGRLRRCNASRYQDRMNVMTLEDLSVASAPFRASPLVLGTQCLFQCRSWGGRVKLSHMFRSSPLMQSVVIRAAPLLYCMEPLVPDDVLSCLETGRE
jgi:hypothetical protein